MIEGGLGYSGLGYWSVLILASLFAMFALVETLRPRRALRLSRYSRWFTHAVFFICNAAMGRALALIIAVGGAAALAQQSNIGLFNLTSWPWWTEAVVAFIILDFAVWLQHIMMHHLPVLWRFHKVHHSDRDLDVSSALRFHPIELAVSVVYKSAWIAILGVPVSTALLFELWLNANALFNHSNIDLPRRIDRLLRLILVTPDMHFVHHSAVMGEQHRNYGFAISLWDRLAGCYQAEAAAGRSDQIVGLAESQDDKPGRVVWSLFLPFRK